MVKDYGFLLRNDPTWSAKAKKISELARDITEVMSELTMAPLAAIKRPVLAYHSACSMQHGQKLDKPPRDLLKAAGFDLREIDEGHICCGSAGSYNILQPVLAAQLRNRKLAHIERTGADAVATGNIGCIQQLAGDRPVLHTVELLDWATGGPRPDSLPPEIETRI